MKPLRLLAGLSAVVLLALCAGCAPRGMDFRIVQDVTGEKPAGFWLGLWHGIIFPITFIVSVFNEKVGVYEAFNVGKLYNLGFFLGLVGSIGGVSKGAGSRDKR